MADEITEEEQTDEEEVGDADTIFSRTLNFLILFWRSIFSIIYPILIGVGVFKYIGFTKETKCGFVLLLMAGFWVTECIPIPVTSLFPLVFFPSFGVLSTYYTSTCYMNDTIIVFMGGLFLAIAIEHANLHVRIALLVMRSVGCSHAKLLAGLCLVTAFVSMWIANAAATAMMVPIVHAILYELERQGLGRVYVNKIDPNEPEIEYPPVPTKVTRAYLFAAAYASTFGGTGALVGTPTNLAFRAIYELTYPKADRIKFGDWIAASMPQMLINLLILWMYLRIAFLGYLRSESKDAQEAAIGEEGEELANELITTKLKALGPMSFHEKGIAVLFVTCVLLWVTRDPGFTKGWAERLSDKDILDSAPVILVCLAMFLIPKDPTFLKSFSKRTAKVPRRPSEALMTWGTLHKKMPWGLVFLLGGGFALSRASMESGLAKTLASRLTMLQKLPHRVVLIIVLFVCNTLTEFTSNVGTANIVLPIVANLCSIMEIHPLYLMFPVTLACSYAFRMPVATPPNAIIMITGNLTTPMMILVGCFPAIYSILVVVLICPIWNTYIFGTDKFPNWAKRSAMRTAEPDPIFPEIFDK